MNIDKLTVCYRTNDGETTALSGVDLNVDTSFPCAIIGPSGSGKSTLLKAMAGLIDDYDGKIFFRGEKIDAKCLTIGFVPQNYGLLPWKTVKENIFLGLKIKNKVVKNAFLEYNNIIEFLSLQGLDDRYPSELSGGQQQRVSLARSFLLHPDLLLMDEPFSSLDIITRLNMQELFMDVWNKYRTPSVIVTHFIEEALYLGKTVVVLGGRPGKVRRVLDSPFFGKKDSRDTAEFSAFVASLRSDF